MAGVVHGNDVVFLVSNGAEYVPFVCAKDVTIETSTALVSIATIGDGSWDKYAFQSLGYSLTLTGVLKFDSANVTAFDLIQHQIQGVDVDYKMIFKDQESNNIKTIKGRALVERSSLTGNYGQFSQTSFSLKGNGAYLFLNCDVTIGSLNITENEDDETIITMQDVEGDAVSFIYTIDNGFEQSTTFTTINLGVLDAGQHSILVIPVCANDERGDEYAHDFIVMKNIPDNPALQNPSAINFTDVSDTSITVNWTQSVSVIDAQVTVRNVTTGFSFSLQVTDPPKTINGLTPGTQYQIRIRVRYAGGYSNGVTVLTTTTNTGNLPGQDAYTDELVFASTYSDNSNGVSGTVGFLDPLTKLEFDGIPGYSGTTHSMSLVLGDALVLTVQFANSYMGQSFRYTHKTGQTFYGNFTAGTINLT